MNTDILAEESQAYIDKFYVTRDELSRIAGISQERIMELEEAQCIPPHSYEVHSKHSFISSFGEYSLPSAPRYYYHSHHIEWIEKAVFLTKQHPLSEVAIIVKSNFINSIEHAFAGGPLPWPEGTDLAWDSLMDGTWGLCIRQFNITGLVQKELARTIIAKFSKASEESKLTDSDKAQLIAAIEQYNHATLPFSPHEIEESSRRLEIEPALKKHNLSMTSEQWK